MDLLVRLPTACSNQPLRVALPKETPDSNPLQVREREFKRSAMRIATTFSGLNDESRDRDRKPEQRNDELI